MRISQSEHKMVVNERNRLRSENVRLIEIIRHLKKKPWPDCEKCGEPAHPQYPCEEAKLLRG